MYPPRAASPRLVLLTSAAGSDVSVVVKHEVKFVLGKSNRQSLVSWIYYFFQVMSFWLSKLFFINYLFINRNSAYFVNVTDSCFCLYFLLHKSLIGYFTFIMAIIVH